MIWKSKGLLKSKLPLLHGAFFPNKIFWMQKRNTIPVMEEQNNYATKVVNALIIITYDLGN